jgi:hypothetical protein
MNFDDNFRRIGSANVEPMKAMLAEIGDAQWQSKTTRQQLYEAHRAAQTVLLVHDKHYRHSEPTRQPALKAFGPVIRPVLGITADFFDKSQKGLELTRKHGIAYFIRASFLRLLPGAAIAEHRDLEFSQAHSHRVHVPVITNDQVWFTVGGETLNIPEGEIYEINNRRPHSVRNEGDEPRVHLVLDYVIKGEMCCCGERLHPDEPCTPEACHDTATGLVPCTCMPEKT